MASHPCILSEDHLQCSLCQCMLTQPVCIQCGHSFCLSCITDHWDGCQQCHCPSCQEFFTSRPKLSVNVLLSKLTNRIRSPGLENVVQICEEPVTEPHSTTNGFLTGRTLLLLLCILAVAIGYAAHVCLDTAPAEFVKSHDPRTVSQKQEMVMTTKERNSFEQNVQTSVNNLDKKLDTLSNKVSALMTNMVETRMTLAKLDKLYSKETTPESKKMKTIQQYAVDVTLDPETAHPNLVLSSDGKQVWHEHTQQNVSNHSKRFDYCISVLSKEGFNSGRFYYEVNVKGKTNWDLGIVQESINRKGEIVLSPTNGYWTIWLRNGVEYAALDEIVVSISPNNRLETVGVFVDYDDGLVSFYDGDSDTHIYSFASVSFTETLYPYFSPGLNLGGKNSAPMTIS